MSTVKDHLVNVTLFFPQLVSLKPLDIERVQQLATGLSISANTSSDSRLRLDSELISWAFFFEKMCLGTPTLQSWGKYDDSPARGSSLFQFWPWIPVNRGMRGPVIVLPLRYPHKSKKHTGYPQKLILLSIVRTTPNHTPSERYQGI